MEALLRRSLGVSLSAKGSAFIRPAPPTAMGPIAEEGVGDEEDLFMDQADQAQQEFGGANDWVDWQQMKSQMEHDEL